MRRFRRLLGSSLIVAALVWTTAPASADVQLPAILGDNMVLQVDQELPFWGTAAPGEKVTVTVGSHSATATADQRGTWQARVAPVSSAGPVAVTIAGTNTIELKNVLVGDVWICSGQSNMEWPVSKALNPEQEIAAAKYPRLRLFKVGRKIASEPQSDVEGAWVECSPETVAEFSAVGYFFGRELLETLDRPIGLVNTSWGGTPAEAWTSHGTLASDSDFQPILDRWADADSDPAKANHHHRASGLYNGMIAPLVPLAIKGAIWYQGESNAPRAFQYRELFPAMIADWRKHWKQGDFPFLFVQLANFKKADEQPVDSDWAELREAQAMTLKQPKTGMAVTIDIGETDDIHPRNKQDVGKRLALAARNVAYGEDVLASGPTFRSMTMEEGKLRLHFDHVGDGLVARGDGPKGFAVAGPDGKFVWADARLNGDTVVVSAPGVSEPRAVRYGWANNPPVNLTNSAGLPAAPFRSDSFPGVTDSAR